jgi:hypothetical protein
MSFSSTAIASGIAGLTISGVTVKDLTGIPDSVVDRMCPILFPSPDGWQAGGNGEPSEGSTTFGTPTTRLWTFNRTYRYVYLHAPIGSSRGLLDMISAMSTKADAILTAITTLDVTDVDVKTVTVGEFGVLTDPAGKSFFGFTLDITFRERLNN